jgi:hypothetical protein
MVPHFLVYLATEDGWCTCYGAEDIPDFCAIATMVPDVTVWDVTSTLTPAEGGGI